MPETPIPVAAANAAAADEKPTHYRDFAASVTQGLDPNGPDVVATITCDSVDADKEVVLPQGADLSRYLKAPRVMLCHAYGRPGEYYPLPIGKALWTKRQGRALVQGIRFARSSAMGREIQGLFEEGMLNTFSIGFLSLEASRPTTQEKSIRPEWRDVNVVHRRWKLLEVSVVPIPCNEDAIGVYLRKGRSLPTFLWLPSHWKGTKTMSGPTVDRPAETPATGPERKPDPRSHDEAKDPRGEKALGESSGTAGGYAAAAEGSEERESTAAEPIGRGHFVKWGHASGMPPGCGKVVSVHKAGRVPGAENELEASGDEPAARVKVYRAADDIHHYVETDRHVAVHLKHLARLDTVTHVPGRKAVTVASDERGVNHLFRDGVEPKIPERPRPAPRARPENPRPRVVETGAELALERKAPPPFRTRAQVLAGIERRIRERLDPEAIAQEAERHVVEQWFGIV